jgi:hypothetical protein
MSTGGVAELACAAADPSTHTRAITTAFRITDRIIVNPPKLPRE